MLYSNMTECLIFVFVVVGMYNLRLLTSSICLVDRYEETTQPEKSRVVIIVTIVLL